MTIVRGPFFVPATVPAQTGRRRLGVTRPACGKSVKSADRYPVNALGAARNPDAAQGVRR